MFKKCLYFFLSVLFLQNACFADTEALKRVNQEYMALMLGTKGILPQKATPEQINQMIDGCITAGIVDRLHNFPSKEAAFRDEVRKFDGYKKLDVELAYAFYKLGYDKSWNEGDTDQNLADINQNFDTGKFYELSAHVYNKGSIVEYRNRLEDVIRRTSKPLRFDDFVEVRAAASPTSMGTITPVTTISTEMTMRPKANAVESALYKKLQALGVASDEIKELLSDYTKNYVEADVDVAGLERYYTDAEIEGIGMPHAGMYRRNMSTKSPQEIRDMLKKMGKTIAPKYEGK